MSAAVERVRVGDGRVRANLQSLRARPLGPVAHTRSPVDQPRPRSRRSAKRGLEDNTTCYGQEKKLWVNIAVCLGLSLSLTLHRSFNPFNIWFINISLSFLCWILTVFTLKCKRYVLIKGVMAIIRPCTAVIMAIQQWIQGFALEI